MERDKLEKRAAELVLQLSAEQLATAIAKALAAKEKSA